MNRSGAAILAALFLGAVASPAAGPPIGDAPASRPSATASRPAGGTAVQLPPAVRAALAQTTDFSLSFSQPGFYALLRYVKTGEHPPDAARPVEIDDWRVLLERPADFRGVAVTITGTVGRNKAWEFVQPERRDLGRVWQLELWSAGQPLAVTAILTDDAGDIPVGATIRVSGYFLMIRNYYGPSNRLHQAALIVGNAPTLISQAAPAAGWRGSQPRLLGVVVVVGTALVLVWLILRRSLSRTPPPEVLRASRPAPESLADELAAWAAQEPDLAPEEPPGDVGPAAANPPGDADPPREEASP